MEGENMRQHIISKFGADAVNRYFRPGNPLEMAGKKLGVNFNLNRRMVSSLNAHRLTLWCISSFPELSEKLINNIFCAYFVEGKDISAISVLIKVAENVGLNPRDAYYVLTSDAFHREVLGMDSDAKSRLRVSGVPFGIINYHNKRRPFNFAGAQVIQLSFISNYFDN
jgi:predicted DsbA family dithiol-disulfide isomerase